MKRWTLGCAVLAFCAALATWAVSALFASDGVDLGVHGALAVFLCLVFVPGLTVALMRLARLSADRGFDRTASGASESAGDKRRGANP